MLTSKKHTTYHSIKLPTRNRDSQVTSVPAVVLLVIVLEVRCNLFEVSYPCDPHQS
mgnify:CR=1 FL=1